MLNLLQHNKLLALGALFLFVPSVCVAASFYANEQVEINTYLPEQGNIYAAGEAVTVSADVTGDVMAAAERVAITGYVEDDVAVAAGEIAVTGRVDGDIRVIGGKIELTSYVDGETLVLADSLLFAEGYVGHEVRALAGRIVFQGLATDDIWLLADTVELSGRFEGNVVITSASQVIVSDTTEILGDLIYEAEEEAQISGDAKIVGSIEYTPHVQQFSGEQFETFASLMARIANLFTLITLLVTATLFTAIFPAFSKRVVVYVLRRGAWTSLEGLASSVGIVFVTLLCALTLFGLMISYGLVLLWLGLVLLAKILTPALAGTMLAQWWYKETIVSWKWTVLGVIVLELLYFVPVLGWLVSMLLFLAIFGSLARGIYERWWSLRQ